MVKIKYFLIAFFTLIIFNTIVNVLAKEKQKTDFVKVPEFQLSTLEVDIVKKKTKTIIGKIGEGKYYKFTRKNTENNIIENIDVTHQKDIQNQMKNKFGSCVSIDFETLFKSKSENSFMNKIYLFKAHFEFKKDVEVRVYLNSKKEIMNLNVMSWEKEIISY